MGDLPGEHQARRRLPYEHRPPVAVGAVRLLAVAAAVDPPLDDGSLHRGFPYVMRARPPRIELIGEDLKGAFDACLNGHGLPDWVAAHGLLFLERGLSFVEGGPGFSACSLNAS